MPKENKSAGLLTHNLNLENENLSLNFSQSNITGGVGEISKDSEINSFGDKFSINDKEEIKEDKKNEINDLGEFGDSDYHEFKEKNNPNENPFNIINTKVKYIYSLNFI